MAGRLAVRSVEGGGHPRGWTREGQDAFSNWLLFCKLFSVSSLLTWLSVATGGGQLYRSAGLNLGS